VTSIAYGRNSADAGVGASYARPVRIPLVRPAQRGMAEQVIAQIARLELEIAARGRHRRQGREPPGLPRLAAVAGRARPGLRRGAGGRGRLDHRRPLAVDHASREARRPARLMAQAGRWERRPALPPPRRTAYGRRDAGPGTSERLDSRRTMASATRSAGASSSVTTRGRRVCACACLRSRSSIICVDPLIRRAVPNWIGRPGAGNTPGRGV
jgi:hypothetical protein